MAALISREKTGKGVWIDCNLFESQVCALSITDGAGVTPFYLDCGVGEHCIEPSNCRARSRQAWHLSPVYCALPGLSLQRWFHYDRRWKRRTGGCSIHKPRTKRCFNLVHQFKKLTENVLRLPELLSDSRFANNRARVDNRDSLVKIITDVLMQNTRDHWLSEFKGLG